MSAYLVFVLITRFGVVLTHIIIVEKILNEIIFSGDQKTRTTRT